VVEEQIKLLERQKLFEEQLRRPGLSGLSVSDTIFQVRFYYILYIVFYSSKIMNNCDCEYLHSFLVCS
jgi:hypothetical protein